MPSKKRKADAEPAPVAKKVKAEVPVANGDGGETGNLFVGNLSWNIDEEWLAREFESFGELKSTRIITDRESGRSKGSDEFSHSLKVVCLTCLQIWLR